MKLVVAEALNMLDDPVYHQLIGERMVLRKKNRQAMKPWSEKYKAYMKKIKSGTSDAHIGEDTRDNSKTGYP